MCGWGSGSGGLGVWSGGRAVALCGGLSVRARGSRCWAPQLSLSHFSSRVTNSNSSIPAPLNHWLCQGARVQARGDSKTSDPLCAPPPHPTPHPRRETTPLTPSLPPSYASCPHTPHPTQNTPLILLPSPSSWERAVIHITFPSLSGGVGTVGFERGRVIEGGGGICG